MYRLRELRRSDLPVINSWRADKELIDRLGATFRYINEEVDERWFNAYMDRRSTAVRCAIVEADKPDAILGLVSLCDIDSHNRSCVFHIMIGDKNQRGKGMGTFAVTEILRHAFEDLNLNRVELTVLPDNEPALKLYRKAGFQQEGLLRQHIYKNGAYRDMILMSILREEWMNRGN